MSSGDVLHGDTRTAKRRFRPIELLLLILFFVFLAPWVMGIWAVGIEAAIGLGASDHAASLWGMFAVPAWFGFGFLLGKLAKRAEA